MKFILLLLLITFSLPTFAADDPEVGINEDFEDGEIFLDDRPLSEIPKLGEIPECDVDVDIDDILTQLIDFEKSLRDSLKREMIDVEKLLKDSLQSEMIDFTPISLDVELPYTLEINPDFYAEEEISDLQKDSIALCAGVSEEVARELEDTREIGPTRALEVPSILDSVGVSNLLQESSNFSEVGESRLLEDSASEIPALEGSKSSKNSAIKSLAYSQCMQLTTSKSRKSSVLTTKSKKKMNLDDLFKVYNKVSKK